MANVQPDAGGRRRGPRILTAADIAAWLAEHPPEDFGPSAVLGGLLPDEKGNIVDPRTGVVLYGPDKGKKTGAGDDEPVDWTSFIDIFGLPPDVMAEVNRIFQSTPDVSQATARAMAYIRGTPWYAQTFPGINEARARGLVVDERDYRRRVNDSNAIYRQYLGRDMTTNEFLSDLGQGVSLDVVGRRFEGQAYIKANAGDIQYLTGAFGDGGPLTEEELKAYGRQQAGLGSEVGAGLSKRVSDAMRRMQRVFEGVLATPTIGMGPSGTSGTSLQPRQTNRADIGI